MDDDFLSLWKIVVEAGYVASDDECGAHQYETSVREEGGGVTRRETFKKKVSKEEKIVDANMRNDGDAFRREEILKREEMGLRTGAKALACGDESERRMCLPSRATPG